MNFAQSRRSVAVAVAILSAAALTFILLAGPAPAGAKVSQPGCGKQKAQVKKAKGKAKAGAKLLLKRCKQARIVYSQVKDSHFYGYRADGILIDTVFCANGKFQGDVGLKGPVVKRGWYVELVSFKNSKNYTAQVIASIKGGTHEMGLDRKGKKWKVGYTYHDEVKQLGDAEKRNARALCSKL